MNIKIPLRAFIAAMLAFTVTVSVITAYFIRNYMNIDFSAVSKISEISRLVDENYYFTVNSENMTDSIISGYVEGLGDRYAKYYNKQDSVAQVDSLNGNSFGIGILAINTRDTNEIYVWKVYENSPADAAGIKPGDVITKIDDIIVKEVGYSEAIGKIHGTKGQKLRLNVLRNGKQFKTTVECAETDMQSVYSYKLKKSNLGIVSVIDFNKKTYTQFKAAVEEFQIEKVKGIIIDLRHNTGGTVASAAKMLDLLLPEGNTLHVKYNDGKLRVRNASGKSFVDLPFAILTDNSTASSSELFASTMRDFGAAVLIGETTYGKSIIQRSYGLSDGTTVKFTVGEFVPKNGESYQGKGIKPDIAVDPGFKSNFDYYYLKAENDKVLKAAVNYMNQLS